jgi:hypothetical protein
MFQVGISAERGRRVRMSVKGHLALLVGVFVIALLGVALVHRNLAGDGEQPWPPATASARTSCSWTSRCRTWTAMPC